MCASNAICTNDVVHDVLNALKKSHNFTNISPIRNSINPQQGITQILPINGTFRKLIVVCASGLLGNCWFNFKEILAVHQCFVL